MTKPKEGSNEFRLTLPISKSFEKEVNGETRMFVAGIASGTGLDHDGERMAESAIQAFEKAIQDGITLPVTGQWSLIPLRSGHRKEWDDVLGWVTKAEIDGDHNLWIEAELDNTSKARDLYDKLTGASRPGRPIQLGFSIGGTIKKASRLWDNVSQKSVRVIEDVVLKEISVVGQPAYPTAYVEALTKSVDWDNVPPPQEEITKESIMANQVDTGSTSNTTGNAAPAQNNDANAQQVAAAQNAQPVEVSATDPQNANAQANPQENVNAVGQVPPVNDAANVENAASAPANAAANADLSAQVQALTQQVQNLAQVVTNLQSKDASKSETTDAEPKVEKAESSLEDRIAAALTAAFTTFKTETIDPLVTDMQAVKSTVTEIAGQPVDKSLSVRASKEVDGAIEKFRTEVEKDRTVSPIAAAVRVAMGQ